MRLKLSFITLFICTLGVWAQTDVPQIIEQMQDNVTVIQDDAINKLMLDKENGVERQTTEISGYRLQVFSSNNQSSAKTEAFRIQKMIEDSDLQTEVYVQYNPPFWKVRLGNFRNISEAQLFKQEVIELFPELQGDTYPVRDQIIVRE